MGMCIFVIIAGLVIYFLIGELLYQTVIWEFLIDYKIDNPIWKLPARLFWPLAIMIVVAFNVSMAFKDYMQEIEDYYENKKGDKNA